MGLLRLCGCASLLHTRNQRIGSQGRNNMSELGDSLERMSFVQLLLLFGFVTFYVLSLGGMFGATLRLRAAGLALVLAIAFTAMTDPWVHGALLVVFVVAGLGLFVMLSWLLARVLGPRPQLEPEDSVADLAADSTADTTTLPPAPLDDGRLAVPKLARRARATR